MNVGLYFDLRNPPAWATDFGRLYGFTLEMCEEAERLGCHSIWLSEHHRFDDGYLPQPLTMAAAVAARTRVPAHRHGDRRRAAPPPGGARRAGGGRRHHQPRPARARAGGRLPSPRVRALRRRPGQPLHRHRRSGARGSPALGRGHRHTRTAAGPPADLDGLPGSEGRPPSGAARRGAAEHRPGARRALPQRSGRRRSRPRRGAHGRRHPGMGERGPRGRLADRRPPPRPPGRLLPPAHGRGHRPADAPADRSGSPPPAGDRRPAQPLRLRHAGGRGDPHPGTRRRRTGGDGVLLGVALGDARGDGRPQRPHGLHPPRPAPRRR